MATIEREPLNRDRILRAALRIVDDEGLDALSMRRLGHELGVEAMSLYHHVPNKGALLAGIVDTMLGELVIPPRDAGDWTDRVRIVAHRYRALAHAHPNAFPLLVSGDLKTPESLRIMDAMLDVCRDAGFGEEGAFDAFCTLGSYVTGFALFEIGGVFALAADEALVTFAGEGHPLAHRSIEEDDARFAFGLDAILSGLASQLSARSNQTVPAAVDVVSA